MVLFCLTLTAAAGRAEDVSFLQNYSTNKISLIAGFVPDASSIIVGEPIFLTFIVSNRAEQPFVFSHVHNEIFTITATNSAGLPVKSHYFGMDGNGFESRVIVAPGKKYTSRIFLNERCIFDEPGDYTVTCRCNFGRFASLTNAFDQPIVTVFKLNVQPSNPERVTEIVQFWAQVVETNGSLNEAAQALAEFNDDPRIIPPLAALVEKDANNYFAVNTLARFTNAAAADALAVVLKSGEAYEASVAKTAIAKAHQADRIARLFILGLTNAEANIRIQNARAASLTGSELAFAPLCALLYDETNTVRYVAAEAIGRLDDPRSFAALTNCLTNSDFALRIAAVKGLLAMGKSLQPEWLLPVLMGRERNGAWSDSLSMLRINGGEKAIPTMLSCLDFDVAWSDRNYQILYEVKLCPNAPPIDYTYEFDLGGKPGYPNGTPEMWATNLHTLQTLKTLAGSILKLPPRPEIPTVPYLITDPPIDFRPVLQNLNDNSLQISSGFLKLKIYRNGANYPYSPSDTYRQTYRIAAKACSVIGHPELNSALKITPEQAGQLKAQIRIFSAKLCGLHVSPGATDNTDNYYNVLVNQGGYCPGNFDWHQLYQNYQEAPAGELKEQAEKDLLESVRIFSQNYHAGTIELAEAAKKIFTPEQLEEILR